MTDYSPENASAPQRTPNAEVIQLGADVYPRLSGRIPELDGLRGIAAVMVVLHHIAQSFPEHTSNHLLALWLQTSRAGWIGVDIFFSLSGFLITLTLIANRDKPHYYRNFYVRRILRLAPPYLITLLLIALFIPDSGKFILLSFFYLANMSSLFGVPMAYGPLWSLSIEEHFYFVWPGLIRKCSYGTLMSIGLIICAASPAFRYVAQLYGFFVPYFSWFRLDGLMWGAILALLVLNPRTSQRAIAAFSRAVGLTGAVIFVVGCAFGVMGRQSILGSTVVFGAVSMATCGLIGMFVIGRLPVLAFILRQRVLRFFGDVSYWIYLIHALTVAFAVWFAHSLMDLGLVRSDWSLYLTITICAFVPAIVSGIEVRRWIELPAQRLKKKFA